MQTEVLDFGIPDNRQVANPDIRGFTVFFQHPGNLFRVLRQLTTTCDFIFALLFTLTPQNPGDNKEGDQANNQCHNCGQNECGP